MLSMDSLNRFLKTAIVVMGDMSRGELLLVGTASVFLFHYLEDSTTQLKHRHLNLPPQASFSLPVIGHTIHMTINPGKFLDWCRAKYGDVFDIKLLWRTVTVVCGRAGEEALTASHAQMQIMEGTPRAMLHLARTFDPTNPDIADIVVPAITKAIISATKMTSFSPQITLGLERGLERLLAKDNTIHTPDTFLQHLVTYMSVPVLVGPEFATNEPIVQVFADFTSDMNKHGRHLTLLPKFVHPFVALYVQPFKRHRAVLRKHIAPVVQAYRQDKHKGAKEVHACFLKSLIEYKRPDGSALTLDEIADALLVVAHDSIYTTALYLRHCIYWLICRPDLLAELQQEMAYNKSDSPMTTNVFRNTPFLDSFIAEVFRQGVNTLSPRKKIATDFTFSNGIQVPVGRMVEVNSRQLNLGLNSCRNTIDTMNPSLGSNRSCTLPAHDYVTFGYGKHACPGRFLAVHEIKVSLLTLFRRYTITAIPKKRYMPFHFATTHSIPTDDPLVFKRK